VHGAAITQQAERAAGGGVEQRQHEGQIQIHAGPPATASTAALAVTKDNSHKMSLALYQFSIPIHSFLNPNGSLPLSGTIARNRAQQQACRSSASDPESRTFGVSK
jgi:hypothetical protein